MTAANMTSNGLVGLSNFSSSLGIGGTVTIIGVMMLAVGGALMLANEDFARWLKRWLGWLPVTGQYFFYGILTYLCAAAIITPIYLLTRTTQEGNWWPLITILTVITGYFVTAAVGWLANKWTRNVRKAFGAKT